ncbi:MAG TPA: hypothetical protein DCE41_33810 [Cytophagales bacterium]|nr:hypothetical protein [Cytophagales bacterium]
MLFLLAMVVLFKSYVYRHDIHVPFFSSFLLFPWPGHFKTIMTTVMLVGVVTVFTKYWRIGCLVIFIVLLLAHLSCRPCYADSRIYLLALFVLLAVYTKELGSKLFQWQICVLYLGAGINKLLDPEWLSGSYMSYWLTYREANIFSSLMPADDLFIYQVISYSVIISELVMALAFLTGRSAFGVWLGLMVHGTSMFVVDGTFGSFVPSVLTSFLVFLPWPSAIKISTKYHPKWNLARMLDPFKFYSGWAVESGDFKVTINNREYTGFRGVLHVMAYSPTCYFGTAFVLLLKWTPGYFLATMVMVVALAIAVDYVLRSYKIKLKRRT